jgi:hypothetical protein
MIINLPDYFNSTGAGSTSRLQQRDHMALALATKAPRENGASG